MGHAEILQKLSAYLDDAVSPREKALIEEHLATCEECRTALHELERTVACLRDLEQVNPPPWLAQRVMARVREEAAEQKGWLRRLFLPLRWKLPLEAAALVFLVVTSILLFRAVSPELNLQLRPEPEVQQSPASPAPPAPAPEQQAGERTTAAPAKEKPAVEGREQGVERETVKPAAGGGEVDHSPETAVPEPAPPVAAPKAGPGISLKASPSPAPMEEGTRSLKEERAQPPGFSADESSRVEKKMKPAPHGKALKENGYAPPPESARGDMERAAPLKRSKSLVPSGTRHLKLVVNVSDREAAVPEIERLAERSGGKVLQRSPRDGKRTVVVRLQWKYLKEFLDRLDWIGDVSGKAAAAALEEGEIELAIEVRAEP